MLNTPGYGLKDLHAPNREAQHLEFEKDRPRRLGQISHLNPRGTKERVCERVYPEYCQLIYYVIRQRSTGFYLLKVIGCYTESHCRATICSDGELQSDYKLGK